MSGPMAGMPDCAMGQHKPEKQLVPCKDMTPGCLAIAGCVALVAVGRLSPATQAPRSSEPQSLAYNASSAWAQYRARSRFPFPPWLNPLSMPQRARLRSITGPSPPFCSLIYVLTRCDQFAGLAAWQTAPSKSLTGSDF